jgi:inosine/xanthosine triphosphatase
MSLEIITGSTNPVKVAIVAEVFAEEFPQEECTFTSFAAPSGVSDQPIGITETKQGAYNRAHTCKEAFPYADYWVGLEGGIELIDEDYWTSAWMCVIGTNGVVGYGRSAAFMLPPEITVRIIGGEELGHATDAVFELHNSKHKGGVVAALTSDRVTRQDFYRDALRFALIPFLKPELYQK